MAKAVKTFMLSLLVALLLVINVTTAYEEQSYKALKFGDTLADYVKLTPDMRPFSNAFSICTWIKKLQRGSYPSWFSYASSTVDTEIWINDDGSYNWIFHNHNRNVGYLINIRMGEWYHYCFCWDLASRTAHIYHNGRESGYVSTPYGRRLTTDGFIVLGQDLSTFAGDFREYFSFGGELQKLNMYSKKLNSTEVKEIYKAGRCSHIETRKGQRYSRELKWERILEQQRFGNVSIVDSCPLNEKLHRCHERVIELEEQLKEAQNNTQAGDDTTTITIVEDDGSSAELDELRLDLERATNRLFETETRLEKAEEKLEKTETRLRKTGVQLDKNKKKVSTLKKMLKQANSDLENNVELLRETRAALREKESELEDLENSLRGANCFKATNSSYWDILYTRSFFNKVVTDELIDILNNSWSQLGKCELVLTSILHFM